MEVKRNKNKISVSAANGKPGKSNFEKGDIAQERANKKYRTKMSQRMVTLTEPKLILQWRLSRTLLAMQNQSS